MMLPLVSKTVEAVAETSKHSKLTALSVVRRMRAAFWALRCTSKAPDQSHFSGNPESSDMKLTRGFKIFECRNHLICRQGRCGCHQSRVTKHPLNDKPCAVYLGRALVVLLTVGLYLGFEEIDEIAFGISHHFVVLGRLRQLWKKKDMLNDEGQ